MNAYQIIRKARFEVDGLRTNNVKSALWSDEECVDYLNTAMDRAARIIRMSGSDLLSKTLLSTDSTVDLVSENYAPSSLQVVSGTTDYTLPPDFVRVVSIIPTTSGFEGVRFKPATTNQRYWMDQRLASDDELASVNNADATFWYTVIGARTLRIVPTPQDTIDIELVYNYRPAKVFTYTSGSLKLTQDSTSVVGVGTEWTTSLRTPAELIVGSVDNVTIDRTYPAIASIGSDTALTLRKAYTGETVSGQSYGIAMVPTIPEEHHSWLAQMVAALMLRKVSIELSDASVKALEGQLITEVTPEVTVRQIQESLPVEPYNIP